VLMWVHILTNILCGSGCVGGGVYLYGNCLLSVQFCSALKLLCKVK
jgi:hypothetical protein